MSNTKSSPWCPFHASAEDLERIGRDVSEIGAIQRRLVEKREQLKQPDRVAHQYQIAGGKVLLTVAHDLPDALRGVGQGRYRDPQPEGAALHRPLAQGC